MRPMSIVVLFRIDSIKIIFNQNTDSANLYLDMRMKPSDRLFHNGDVFAMDSKQPGAGALATRNGLIVAVGSADECKAALHNGYEETDLAGRALLPGFIDTHLHPIMMVFYDMNLDLRDARSMSDIMEMFSVAAKDKSAEEWVVGLDFNEENITERKLPTRHDLDGACPDHPAIIIKHDGHSIIANTAAIDLCGISASSPDPEWGKIDREPGGYPAGPFRESAATLILSNLPMPNMDSLIQGVDYTFDRMAACGITSAGAILQADNEGPAGESGGIEVIALSMLIDRAKTNFYSLLMAKEPDQVTMAQQSMIHNQNPGEQKVGGIKIYFDGSFGSATAFMNEPFSDQPENRGFLTNSEKEVFRRMEFAHKSDLQIAVHTIGDAATEICVDLYEKLLDKYPKSNHRHRLEHASLFSEITLEKAARLGLLVSTQPLFIHSEKQWLYRRLGPDRCRRVYPFRSILDAGIKLAGASDAPVESIDVLHAIECCVTREGFETHESISPDEAIRMYTADAAYMHFEEDVKGSLTVGKRADMVILSDNPVRQEPDKIHDIKVIETINGGKTVFRSGTE